MERNMSLSMKDRRQQKNHIAIRNPNQISSNANNYNVNNPKDHHYSWNHHHVFKNNQSYEDQDYLINGFSWPPRSYTCSFCNREFRSAQALGGHMNVHRKDRARLRQSPPKLDNGGRYGTTAFLNLNLNSNPNPNFSSSSSSPSLIASPLSSLASPPLSSLSSSSPIYSTFFPNNNINSYYENKKLPWTSVDQSLDPLTVNGLDLAITMKNKQSANCGPGEQHNYGFAGKSIYCNSLNNGADHQTTTTVRLDLEIGLLGADSKMGRDLDLELRLGYSN